MRRLLRIGEPAPWFLGLNAQNPRYAFDSIAGRWIVLLFFGTRAAPGAEAALQFAATKQALLERHKSLFFGVSIDPRDAESRDLASMLPAESFFWDFDRNISNLYGTFEGDHYYPAAFLIDPALRIAAVESMSGAERIWARFAALAEAEQDFREKLSAPVLVVPRIFPPELCQALIAHYGAVGPFRSGVMREIDGKTVGVHDDNFKRRKDVVIQDEALRRQAHLHIASNLLPMVERSLQWKCTRIERNLIACYRADDLGFFSAHRDNTTSGTAHRKFAVSVNLNADDYDGGDLCFPEFGARTYRAPTGGAVVFSCSLLHEVKPVTRGDRYAFLPFLYDEDGALIREKNLGAMAGAAAGDKTSPRA